MGIQYEQDRTKRTVSCILSRRSQAAEMAETVGDGRPYVAEASVCLVPLRIGGGTRLKIFEALAMGKAVVSTTNGAEGLPLIPETHCLMADDPDAFSRAVISLLLDPTRRPAPGTAGRQLVKNLGMPGPRWLGSSKGGAKEVLAHAN